MIKYHLEYKNAGNKWIRFTCLPYDNIEEAETRAQQSAKQYAVTEVRVAPISDREYMIDCLIRECLAIPDKVRIVMLKKVFSHLTNQEIEEIFNAYL